MPYSRSLERDDLHIFDFCSKVASLTQNKDSIEVFYGKTNVLWKEINCWMPNSIVLQKASKRSTYLSKETVSTNFSLELRIHWTKNIDIFSIKILPTVDVAYAINRCELVQWGIMSGESSLGPSISKVGSMLAMPNQYLSPHSNKMVTKRLIWITVTVSTHLKWVFQVQRLSKVVGRPTKEKGHH